MVNKMAIKPRIRPDINPSPQLHFLGGHFSLGPNAIPYVTTHMTIAQLTHYLQTPEQLPGWTDGPTEIEALYQRQLDYKRVKKKILPYLAETNSDRPRFFNSITVALFPYKNHEIKPFENGDCTAPELEDSGAEYIIKTGPVTLGTYEPFDPEKPETFSLGEMRWNKDQTATVAIDGQHRLAACQLLHNANPEAAERTRVCVMFIIPSAQLGYTGQTGERSHLLSLLRSIFIDLNKHAKPVKRSRLILLDDADPHSLIVRRMLGNSLKDITASDPADGDKLPLALVDWHTDDAKFESGPYLTTVLMLDRIVQTIIGGVKPVTDWTDKKSVAKQLDAFKRFDFVPSDEFEKRYNEFQEAEDLSPTSFSYPQNDLEEIVESIGNICSPIVCSLLLRLKPYTDLVKLRSDYNMLGADFSNWYEAYCSDDGTPESSQRLQRIEEHLKHRETPPKISDWKHCLDEEISKIKHDNLFFKVVFQAALFDCLQQLWRTPLPVIEEASLPKKGSSDHLRVWCDAFISTLNRIAGQDEVFFNLYKKFSYNGKSGTFWAGSVLNLDKDSVDFTGAGLYRTACWLKFLAMLDYSRIRWLEVWKDAELPSDFRIFVRNFSDEDPDFGRELEKLTDRIIQGNSANPGSMWRLVRSLEDDIEDREEEGVIEELARQQFEARVHFVWDLLNADNGS